MAAGFSSGVGAFFCAPKKVGNGALFYLVQYPVRHISSGRYTYSRIKKGNREASLNLMCSTLR